MSPRVYPQSSCRACGKVMTSHNDPQAERVYIFATLCSGALTRETIRHCVTLCVYPNLMTGYRPLKWAYWSALQECKSVHIACVSQPPLVPVSTAVGRARGRDAGVATFPGAISFCSVRQVLGRSGCESTLSICTCDQIIKKSAE